tara:strand:- start:12830 stop:13297 length:468 start_codon:yes stop_codon:yes gene_type:complete
MSTLTVTVTEAVVLNGNQMGGSNMASLDVSNATQIVKSCPPQAETVLGNYAATVNATAYANFDFDNSIYTRITNLSTTDYIEAAFVSLDDKEVADSCRFLLLPNQSAIMYNAKGGKLGECSVPNFARSMTNLAYITIFNRSEENAVNIEVFNASK